VGHSKGLSPIKYLYGSVVWDESKMKMKSRIYPQYKKRKEKKEKNHRA
jgi:5'-3' exonuclease